MDDEETSEDRQTVEEEVAALATAMDTMDPCGKMSESLRKGFREVQRELRLLKEAMLRQTSILDHFSKK